MRTFAISLLVFFFLAMPASSVFAQTSGVDTSGNVVSGVDTSSSGTNITLVNPLKGVNCSSGNGNCLAAFLNNILDFMIRIGTIVIVIMMVFVGYKFVVAQGNPGEIEKAKQMLLWTVVGALILLGAKAISLGIQATVTALGG